MNIFLLVMVMLSCSPVEQNRTENPAKPSKKGQLVKVKQDSLKILDPQKRKIEWQFNGMAEAFQSELEFSLPQIDQHAFEWKNKDYVSLRFSCGSPCWHSYVFPISDPKQKVKRFLYSLGYDKNRSLIAYQPNDLPDGMMMRIENIQTGKNFDLPKQTCPADLTFLCVEEITFTNDSMHIHWKQDFFDDANVPLQEKNLKVALPQEVLGI